MTDLPGLSETSSCTPERAVLALLSKVSDAHAYLLNFKYEVAITLTGTLQMDLQFGQCMDRADTICSVASVLGCDAASEMELKKDNGNSVLTKDERIEKVIVSFFSLHDESPRLSINRLHENFGSSSNFHKIDTNLILPVYDSQQGRFMNRVANMKPERRMKKLMSDRYENMSEERRIKKKEV